MRYFLLSTIVSLLSLLITPHFCTCFTIQGFLLPRCGVVMALLLHFYGFVRNWCCLLPYHGPPLRKQAQRSPSMGKIWMSIGERPAFGAPCKSVQAVLAIHSSHLPLVRLSPFSTWKSPPLPLGRSTGPGLHAARLSALKSWHHRSPLRVPATPGPCFFGRLLCFQKKVTKRGQL